MQARGWRITLPYQLRRESAINSSSSAAALLGVLFFAPTAIHSQEILPPIGQINFFGYGGIDVHAVELALLVKLGDVIRLDNLESTQHLIEQRIRRHSETFGQVTEPERLSDALLVGSTEIAAAHRVILSRFPRAKFCSCWIAEENKSRPEARLNSLRLLLFERSAVVPYSSSGANSSRDLGVSLIELFHQRSDARASIPSTFVPAGLPWSPEARYEQNGSLRAANPANISCSKA